MESEEELMVPGALLGVSAGFICLVCPRLHDGHMFIIQDLRPTHFCWAEVLGLRLLLGAKFRPT
jgi:hypothetical protein